jgi:hypothetical protein
LSIADRVDKAISDLYAGDFENSLIQISIAIDATGKRRTPRAGVGERCRTLINENEDLIFHFAMDGRLKIIATEGVQFGDRGNLGQVLYKSVRCALLHEADVSNHVKFASGLLLGQDEGKFIITERMLLGLILVVVGDATNLKEQMKSNHIITYNQVNLPINELWGRLPIIKYLADYKEPSEMVALLASHSTDDS